MFYCVLLTLCLSKAETISFLKSHSRKFPIQEKKSGKTHTIKDFKDKEAIKTALPVLDLIDCIKPGTVDYSNVVDKPDSTDEVE